MTLDGRLLSGITGAFDNANDDVDTKLLKLEEVLLQADLGSVTTKTIVDDLRVSLTTILALTLTQILTLTYLRH